MPTTAVSVLLMSMAATMAPISASAFDFKGIELGAPSTPNVISEKLGVSCGEGAKGMQICNGSVTIAKESATMNLVISHSGIVQRIALTLPSETFDVVSEAMVEKFGKPDQDMRSELQNGFGAKFTQRTLFWLKKDGRGLMYSRYGKDVKTSSIYFGTKEDVEMLRAPKENRKSDL